jgi:hypothetical protein
MIIGRPLETEGQTVESLVALAESKVRELLPSYHEPSGIKLLRRGLTRLF